MVRDRICEGKWSKGKKKVRGQIEGQATRHAHLQADRGGGITGDKIVYNIPITSINPLIIHYKPVAGAYKQTHIHSHAHTNKIPSNTRTQLT